MKILIADDDEIARVALKEILKTEGSWEYLEASSGPQALQLLNEGPAPELFVFDLRMPEMDGVHLLEKVRENPAFQDLKAIATSANRDRDTIVALAKLGVSGYLLKPYDPAKTRGQIHQLLDTALIADPNVISRNLLSKTLLLVDDDEVTRVALKSHLKEETGWDIHEASDGMDALARLRSGLLPDVMMLDLRMPNLDGHNLLERIRADPYLKNLPVVVISSEQDRAKVIALARLQISGYLLKPFVRAKVVEALRSAARQGDRLRGSTDQNAKNSGGRVMKRET